MNLFFQKEYLTKLYHYLNLYLTFQLIPKEIWKLFVLII